MATLTLELSKDNQEFTLGMKMVQEALEEYKSISMFDDYMYEAFGKKKQNGEKPEEVQNTENQMQANAEATKKAKSGLMKVVDAVFSMIKKLKTAITDFIDRRTMDKDERARFEQLEAAMKRDPSLRNKKMTVSDFRKFDAEYNGLIRDLENEIKLCKKESYQPSQELINRCKHFINRGAGDLKSAVVATSLVNIAGIGRTEAKSLARLLKNDQALCEKMRADMGDQAFNKMNKEIRSLSHVWGIQNLKMRVMGRRYDDIFDATMDSVKAATSLVGIGKVDDTVINMKEPENMTDEEKAALRKKQKEVKKAVKKQKGNQKAFIKNFAQGEVGSEVYKKGKEIAWRGGVAGAKDKAVNIIKAGMADDPDSVRTDDVHFFKKKNQHIVPDSVTKGIKKGGKALKSLITGKKSESDE